MAITFRTYAANSSGSTVDLSANPPAAGERGIAWSVSDSTSTSGAGPGTGWTQAGGAWVVVTTDAMSFSVWTKDTAFAGGETSVFFTTSTVNMNGVMAIGGLDATTFIDVTIPAAASSSTGSASPRTITLAITPATNGALLVAVIASDNTVNTDSTFSASDTGGLTWTTQADQYDSNWRNAGVCTAIQPSAAATTVTGQATYASGNAGIAMFVLALRPATGAATSLPFKNSGTRLAPYLHF